ncbi:MAG: hypothetical protein MUE70_09040 [Desulfobacterales bacterium]|nr:hypothetical protein [Desulfobacterales bacterium]
MNTTKAFKNKSLARCTRFLIFATSNIDVSSFEGQWVSSPIRCLGRAVEVRPQIIAIRFGQMPIQDRQILVDLCTELKQNSFTSECKLLLLLHRKHRKLIEDLANTKADYIRFMGDDKLDLVLMREIINGLGPEDRLESLLISICPFLNYTAIDTHHELKVCGAYLDRMVLGDNRLNEICETANYHCCEYYLNPRTIP